MILNVGLSLLDASPSLQNHKAFRYAIPLFSSFIVTRIPFAVPNHPLIQSRLEQIENSGGNPFLEYSVPEAILKLRQGVGRLIRSASDKGFVVILDNRVLKMKYGKAFIRALPPLVPTAGGENSIEALKLSKDLTKQSNESSIDVLFVESDVSDLSKEVGMKRLEGLLGKSGFDVQSEPFNLCVSLGNDVSAIIHAEASSENYDLILLNRTMPAIFR